MTDIAVSAPLQYYFAGEAHQNAVDDVIDANLSGASPKSRRQRLPQDLSWSELEAAHNATLAALKIQVDFWSFLKHAWETTWGSVASVRELKGKEVPPADYEGERDLGSVWESGWLYKSFEHSTGHLVLGCYFTREDGVQLVMYFNAEEDYSLSNNLPLSDNWLSAEDDERYTKKGLAVIAGDFIDVSVLQDCAREAVDRLFEAFPD
jgi:hypothetical protein